MPTTPVLALPYPVATDPADVPKDIKALADRLDALQGAAGAGLPASPVDGQQVSVVIDAANGVVWQFRYRAAAGAPYRWEFIGGASLFAEVVTAETTNSAAYVDLATAGPSLTVPLAGDYLVEIGVRVDVVGDSTGGAMSYAIGATAANDADFYALLQQGANGPTSTAFRAAVNGSRARRKNALPASTALVAKYKNVIGGTPSFSSRWMRVTPIRVG